MRNEERELFDAINTACSLLAVVGWDNIGDGPYYCQNCDETLLHPDDFGHRDNHPSDCAIPGIFASKNKARQEMEQRRWAAIRDKEE
jgi:hypothetical protein